jgi:hypothetical protein
MAKGILGRAMTVSNQRIVFLHIGKNAGTQIAFLCKQLIRYGVVVDGVSHDVKLKRIESGRPYFFSIRDPVSRFRSGFYSRKRKGQPRLYVEWSRYEAYAFEKFEHANELAESLFRRDAWGRDAIRAISSIRHTSMQQIDWFEGALNFELRPPVWIIRQEKLEQDFNKFLKRLDLEVELGDLLISSDAKMAHKNDYSDIPDLSDLAMANLRRWYARDVAFYELCVEWMDEQGSRYK